MFILLYVCIQENLFICVSLCPTMPSFAGEKLHKLKLLSYWVFVFAYIISICSSKALESSQMALKSSELNYFHRLKEKAKLIELDIQFLKQCKYEQIFPKFIKIKIPIINKTTEKVVKNAKLNWLKLEIKNFYAKQNDLELKTMEHHLKISKSLDPISFNIFIEKLEEISKSITFKYYKKKTKLEKKLKYLKESQIPISRKVNKTPNDLFKNEQLVYNHSKEIFSDKEISLLSKGLNFNLENNSDTRSLIIDVESNIQFLNEAHKTAIRSALKSEITNNKKMVCNTNKELNQTLSSLQAKNVFYLKADKSNAIVIIDKNEYFERVDNMLKTGPYKVCEKTPLAKYVSNVNTTIKECTTIIDCNTRKHLHVSNPIIPRLYCLPKIHKPGNSMRPIVSSINNPTYLLSKFLVQKLQTLNSFPTFSIKNRSEFLESIKNTKVYNHEYLVSFDVTALYPNVPIQFTITLFQKWFENLGLSKKEQNEYTLLINTCMSQNVFKFNEKYYSQIEGTAMGNPLSCLVANIFMSHFEIQAKEVLQYFPRIWLRYVDDVFAIFDKSQDLNLFVQNLNSFFPTIKFTFEVQSENKLPFLDILLINDPTSNFLSFDIYRKPTHTNRYILNESYHPPSQKRAAFHSMIHRLINTPLSEENYKKELNYIKDTAIYNGFSTKLIDDILNKALKHKNKSSRTTLNNISKEEKITYASVTYNKYLSKVTTKTFKNNGNVQITFKTKNKLKNKLPNPKDRIEDENNSGIYEIKCDNCGVKYIGQTRRNLKTRFKEHLSHIKFDREEKSAVAKHCLNNSHSISSKNSKLLKPISSSKTLNAWETYYINKTEETLMNNDSGPIQNSSLLTKGFLKRNKL